MAIPKCSFYKVCQCRKFKFIAGRSSAWPDFHLLVLYVGRSLRGHCGWLHVMFVVRQWAILAPCPECYIVESGHSVLSWSSSARATSLSMSLMLNVRYTMPVCSTFTSSLFDGLSMKSEATRLAFWPMYLGPRHGVWISLKSATSKSLLGTACPRSDARHTWEMNWIATRSVGISHTIFWAAVPSHAGRTWLEPHRFLPRYLWNLAPAKSGSTLLSSYVGVYLVLTFKGASHTVGEYL